MEHSKFNKRHIFNVLLWDMCHKVAEGCEHRFMVCFPNQAGACWDEAAHCRGGLLLAHQHFASPHFLTQLY